MTCCPCLYHFRAGDREFSFGREALVDRVVLVKPAGSRCMAGGDAKIDLADIMPKP
jgi:hypothetical protein